MSVREKNISTDLAGHLERIEVAAWGDFHKAASRQIAANCGIGLIPLESICGAIASKIDVLAFNRVIGLGMTEPVTEETLDEIISEYRDRGARRFFVQLCSSAVPDDIPDWLLSRGFHHYNNWVKLYRGVKPCPKVETDLDVRQIGTEESFAFARILVSSFEWPVQMEPWVARMIGRPGWRHYMAYDGKTPVATAALYVEGENGWIDFASTLPDYRGRGAQGALVERRIRDGAESGCKRLVVETAEETPEKLAPSYRNMRRFGFETAYIRPNYLYTVD
jgi:GNAT superfamily N-acetyltransferase